MNMILHAPDEPIKIIPQRLVQRRHPVLRPKQGYSFAHILRPAPSSKGRQIGTRHSRQHTFHHISFHAREALVEAVQPVGEALVIHAEKV